MRLSLSQWVSGLSTLVCKSRGTGKNQCFSFQVAGSHSEKPTHQMNMYNLAFYILQNVQTPPRPCMDARM